MSCTIQELVLMALYYPSAYVHIPHLPTNSICNNTVALKHSSVVHFSKFKVICIIQFSQHSERRKLSFDLCMQSLYAHKQTGPIPYKQLRGVIQPDFMSLPT